MNFLAETALLTHGLRSVDETTLRDSWPFKKAILVWVDQGTIVRGTMEDYLPFRRKSELLCRIDCNTLDQAVETGMSGALTASGTMAVCEKLGIPLAVTCGMGGIGDIKGETLCPDLPALLHYPVALISTSPKDMLDIPATIAWLQQRKVHVAGPDCTGYIFESTHITLQESLSAYNSETMIRQTATDAGLLLLQPIPSLQRIKDLAILHTAIAAGKQAEAARHYYHPAVNGKIDELTSGYSSRIQLDSFINNIRLANTICSHL